MKELRKAIMPLLHTAIDEVKAWPTEAIEIEN